MVFAAEFTRFADHICLRDGDTSLTYAQTLALGRQLTTGLRPRSLVVLRCAVTIEAVAAYAALLVDGHVPLLLEDSLTPALADAIIDRYAPDAVVSPASGDVQLRAGGTVLHPDLALLLTTSGSTGSPKLVRLGAAGVAANAAAIASYLGLTAAERAFVHLPISYSYGMSILNSHFSVGASVCLTRRSVMEAGYWDELAAQAATSIAGVPFHYTTIRRLGEARLAIPSLTTLTQAGGRLDPRIVSHFADWAARTGRRFIVMYGQTEAGPRIAYLPPDKAAAAPDAIGIPIPGVTIALHDNDGAPVADGTPGEMVIHSPAVMLG
ncbi:MAG: AMP-binding protein [Polymorphobacter sp.]